MFSAASSRANGSIMQGKTTIHDIYELMNNRVDATPAQQKMCLVHNQAMHKFIIEKDYMGALQQFQELYREHQGDLPIFLMKQRLKVICRHPHPGQIWSGFQELKEK